MVADSWRSVQLGEVATLQRGFDLPNRARHDGDVPVVTSSGIGGTHNKARVAGPGVVTGRYGTIGEVFLVTQDFWPLNTTLYVKDFHGNEPRFVAHLLRTIDFQTHSGKSGVPGVNRNDLHKEIVAIPVSTIEQRRIAEALDDAEALLTSLQDLIEKRRNVQLAVARRLLTGDICLPGFAGGWTIAPFSQIAKPSMERVDPRHVGSQPFCVELEHIAPSTGRLTGSTAAGGEASIKSVFRRDDVLFGKLRSYLRKYWLADRDGVCSTEIWVLVANRELVVPAYLFQLVKAEAFIRAASSAYGTHMPRSDWNVVQRFEVPLPPLDEQRAIGAVLSNMNVEIDALEARLVKTRDLKTAMAQELLSGRTRLA